MRVVCAWESDCSSGETRIRRGGQATIVSDSEKETRGGAS
jgi:hypothetical protein